MIPTLVRRFLRRGGRRPAPVLFDHLPKCAGTTLTRYLSARYPRELTFETKGTAPAESVAEFLARPEADRLRFRLVTGHLADGLLDAVRPDVVPVTLLRDPVDRILSHYFYARREPLHYLHARINGTDGGGGIAVDDYVDRADSVELKNWYVAHFSGRSPAEVAADPADALRRALDRLTGRYRVIGFQDALPAAAARLREATGLRGDFSASSANRTAAADREQVSEETRRRIAEANALDLRLYRTLRECVPH